MIMTTKKENTSFGSGGDHNSNNSQKNDVSMDCENNDDDDDDDDRDHDNPGDDQYEESAHRQNEAWYTVRFLGCLFGSRCLSCSYLRVSLSVVGR